MPKPTYSQLVSTLSSMLGAFSTVDAIVDGFASANGIEDDEKRMQSEANEDHTKAIETYTSALAEPALVHIAVSPEQHATILAALRFYQSAGMGDPENRSPEIHTIATNDDEITSLDDAGIDELCESIN